RIGESLRSARERSGWSREALAYHSGVSWSAIAQIESGRRKDIRLSSLAALAEALDLSVDYLIGRSATFTSQLLEHRALAYGSDAEFLAAAIPYLAEGIERSDSVLAVTSASQIGLLRDALDDRSAYVEFADSVEWYRSPRAALHQYHDFVKEKFEAGAPWIRVLGEPVWAGRSAAEVDSWTRYESIINLMFASSPVSIMCPYDAHSLPGDIVADACRTHPELARGTDATASAAYLLPEDFLLERS
ncbi:MAG: hypothetical protein QOD72_2956, partial [Acidimicrobiaceae bacterium]|nr:hypothetical protein [Acidimicrobiaceae bacterium]